MTRRKLLWTTNSNSYTSIRLVPRSMTLNDIWRSFLPMLSFPRAISPKFIYDTTSETEVANKKSHDSFQLIRLSMIWRNFKVSGLFHVKFLVNGALYGKSYYRLLIGNHAAFDWCHFWWPWRTFQCIRLSFFGRLPRRVVSKQYSWASC